MTRIEREWCDIFAPELALVQDEKLKAKMFDILDDVEAVHKCEPASSTGKYHPQFAQGDGGLVRHTKAVVWLTVDMLRARPDLVDEQYTQDVYVLAAILHDMCKYHGNSKFTQFDHPAEMASRCKQIGLQAVAVLIGPHMGRWNSNPRSPTRLEFPRDERQWLLHYADYIASRTWLQMQFDEDDNAVGVQ